MGNNQALKPDDNFAVLEALYQEAEQAAQTMPKPSVIMSRKPKEVMQTERLFTRISDLYEEAEATRFYEEEALDAQQAPSDTSTPADASKIVDEFAIPADFSLPDEAEAEAEGAAKEEAQADDDSESELTAETEANAPAITPETFTPETKDEAALTDEELALLSDTLDETSAETPSDDVTISDEIEPAIALDDVLEGLMPAESDTQTQDLSDEAKALAALDANRPPADEALTEQLEAVKSAVAQAQINNDAPADDETPDNETSKDEASQDEVTSAIDDSFAPVSAGPALAAFIGETVRDVLDEELPQMVRGLVDEALGERQGRYGRSDTPHIGLRTKPSRH